MPEPYIPHSKSQWNSQTSRLVGEECTPRTPVPGKPPMVEVDTRKGRFVTTGDDTPTLVTLVILLVCLIVFTFAMGGLS